MLTCVPVTLRHLFPDLPKLVLSLASMAEGLRRQSLGEPVGSLAAGLLQRHHSLAAPPRDQEMTYLLSQEQVETRDMR